MKSKSHQSISLKLRHMNSSQLIQVTSNESLIFRGMSRVFRCRHSQDVADAEPESLAEDDEKELSVVHPARCGECTGFLGPGDGCWFMNPFEILGESHKVFPGVSIAEFGRLDRPEHCGLEVYSDIETIGKP